MKETWKIGKHTSVVVIDAKGDDFEPSESTGHDGPENEKYYGGPLVCESIRSAKAAKLIAAAPELLIACMNLENDDEKIPKHAWDLIQSAIKKAIE